MMNIKLVSNTVLTLIIFATLAACGGGSGNTPTPATVAIATQPANQSVVVGAMATFTVVASNATAYQWQISTNNGSSFADVAGATSASYTTPVTVIGDNSKQYRALVTGAGNTVTSSAVTLTVTAAPVAPRISAHPAAQTITAGQNASFSVTASGTALSYQWQHSMNGGTTYTNEAGATSATLTLTAVAQLHNGHLLRVVVSNSLGSVTSNAALLTVNAAPAVPAFTTHPANLTIIAGQNATFTVAVIGNPAPTLKWQMSADNGITWNDISLQTGISYTAVGAALANNWRQFRAVATNTSGSTNSNPATLTVNPAPAGVWDTMLWDSGNWG